VGAGQTLTGSAATDTLAFKLSVSCVPVASTVSCSFALKVWFSARGPRQTVSQSCCNQMQVHELYHHLVWLSKSATKLAGSNSKTPYSRLQPQNATASMPVRPSVQKFTVDVAQGMSRSRLNAQAPGFRFERHASMQLHSGLCPRR